ncbi:unnamed protein product [Soboliphyme baturini]|uniref:XRN_M domain-containing protein n=1 Tax=Soboliphyme baturini TaxID=241478 RepID=A0A183J074_9BILA|nr:unnamed protein product [Soboliphyme baturini]
MPDKVVSVLKRHLFQDSGSAEYDSDWSPVVLVLFNCCADADSPIIDFYPEDFKVDLNGKKFAWQGVALLPFVDPDRLQQTLKSVYPMLTKEEEQRNIRGHDRLFVSRVHPLFSVFVSLCHSNQHIKWMKLNSADFPLISGDISYDPTAVSTGSTVESPLPGCSNIPSNTVISVHFRDPLFDVDFVFPAVRLPGAM